MATTDYVHGYSDREAERLADQAGALRSLLHGDTAYPVGSRVLECGCGTGAQTALLAASSPGARLVSVDISADSIGKARSRLGAGARGTVAFGLADVFRLPFARASFDHVFVCFLLEHLREPARALGCLREVLRPGGSITVIEGDHGSWYCHPQTPEAERTVQCLIESQARMGGVP